MSLCSDYTVFKENASLMNIKFFYSLFELLKDSQFPSLFSKCLEPESYGASEVKQEVEFVAEEL